MSASFVGFSRQIEPLGDYVDLVRLAEIFTRLGNTSDAIRVRSLAIGSRIRTGQDVAQALTGGTKENFQEVFDAALSFFERDSTSYARRKFLQTVMSLGTPEQRERTAKLMALWLRQQKFPSQETRLTLDLCTYASKQLAERHVNLVADYADSPTISMETVLAAIRMIRRTRHKQVFLRLEQRFIREINASKNNSEVAIDATISLAKAAATLFRGEIRLDLYEVLLRSAREVNSIRSKVPLINAAIQMAPIDRKAEVEPLIADLLARSRGKAVMRAAAWFERRFASQPAPAAAPFLRAVGE